MFGPCRKCHDSAIATNHQSAQIIEPKTFHKRLSSEIRNLMKSPSKDCFSCTWCLEGSDDCPTFISPVPQLWMGVNSQKTMEKSHVKKKPLGGFNDCEMNDCPICVELHRNIERS
mmetsp:Transcript_69466/g.113662  ORF Transcript_69466/g.113662 Transcript_69466/m.113662 type:complete len:115 (-) Transcript_69466:153-497(-)